jgi:sugar lactone lactonase YvrE
VDNFVLKGGLFIFVLTDFGSRSTIDVDFLLRGISANRKSVVAVIEEILSVDSGHEFIRLEIVGADESMVQNRYHGVTIKLVGIIKNTRTPFHVDIGIGDSIVPGPRMRRMPTQLTGFEAPLISTYSLESTIAEKLDAILDRMELTSRMKDYFDIVYLARKFDFSGDTLQNAIRETLRSRRIEYSDGILLSVGRFASDNEMQTKWRLFLKRIDGDEESFDSIVDVLERFIGPVWNSMCLGLPFNYSWECQTGRWLQPPAGGSSMNVETVHAGICHLGECPLWDARSGRLIWTDVLSARLWAYDPETGRSEEFLSSAGRVSGFAFTRDGGLVLFSSEGVLRVALDADGRPAGRPESLLPFRFAPGERFNDVTVDPAGRIFAGTLFEGHPPDGSLYRLERGQEPVPVLHGLRCTNGMTFSLDERTFFHTDSGTRRITRYDYDRETGGISNARPFFEAPEGLGVPDGITLDAESFVWVAMWGGACVLRLDGEGRIARRIDVPAKQPSSVMFGGARLDELYVTSACEGGDDVATGMNRDGTFLGGPLYRVRPGVAGRAEFLADFPAGRKVDSTGSGTLEKERGSR